MASSKKGKTNADEPLEQEPAVAPLETEQREAETAGHVTATEPDKKDAQSANSAPTRPTSWYGGGSWRSKASPVAQIAKESISVAKGATSESSEESSRRPSQSVSKSVRGSRKSIPLAAEATRVHATSDALDKSRPRFPSEEKLRGVDGSDDVMSKEPKANVEESAPLPQEPAVEGSEDEKSIRGVTERPQTWFGWWSRPDGYASDGERTKASNKRRKLDVEQPSDTPPGGLDEAQPANQPTTAPSIPDTDIAAQHMMQNAGAQSDMQDNAVPTDTITNAGTSRSWFGLWSSAQNQQAAAEAQATEQHDGQTAKAAASMSENAIVAQTGEGVGTGAEMEQKKPPKSSGWAFWSPDRPQGPPERPGEPQKEVGELAVADTPSQSHPEAAQFTEQQQQLDVKRTNSLLRPKRGKMAQLKEDSGGSSASTPADSKSQSRSASQAPTPAEPALPVDDLEVPVPVMRGKVPQSRPNLVLPTFTGSYPLAPNPGYLERLTAYLAQTLRFPGSSAVPVPNHVCINPTPPKVKKAIAIGVHGFFPAPIFARVLGQPTGTSIRFANYAAASIKAWCREHQPDVKDVEIEKVALEGEGLIADRVDTLWKLLLNWLSHLRQADFILVAAHSQGVPVGVMLLAKLIQLGCLSPKARLGICAIAGINLGPFLEYRSRFFAGSALELFDFCDPQSAVSKAYVESLDLCLRHGVRVSFIGGLDDQLVSLESSLFAPLSHPYVNRAVFVDGRIHSLNFLIHLVIFALKLRNLGVSDHGLLRELSTPLAGSLVGGEGHSRVYDDPAVYRLAVDFALGSTDATPPAVHATPTAAASLLATDKVRARSVAAARRASLSGYPTPALANSIRRGDSLASTQLPGIAPLIAPWAPSLNGANANPFYLPWAVRGMLEEELVKRDAKLQDEVATLVKEFEEWRPTSKGLKDVRWRLDGVRSMV